MENETDETDTTERGRTTADILSPALVEAYRDYNEVLTEAEKDELKAIWDLPSFKKVLARLEVQMDSMRTGLMSFDFTNPANQRKATLLQGKQQGVFFTLETFIIMAEIK